MTTESERPDDEKIGAWLDGELDPDGATGMTISSATNAAIAARAERLRQIDGLVRAAVPEEEALPDELVQRLGLAATSDAPNVIPLAARRRSAGAQAANEDAGTTGWSFAAAPWRMAAQVAFVIGVGLSGMMLLNPPGPQTPEESYRTLSDKVAPADLQAAPPTALVIFTRGTDAETARRIVRSAGGTLVGAPNDAGAWKVAVAPAQRDSVVAALRQDRRVTMAEPLTGGTP